VTTACVEHVDLDYMCRRLEEDYERHTKFLADVGVSGSDADTDQLIVQQLITNSRQALTDIATAIQAIVDGSYGLCGHCGQRIARERLEVRPQAAYCVDCEERVSERPAPEPLQPPVNPRRAGRAPATRAASRRGLRHAS
jgi:DnaK suppressor protein